MQANAHAHLGTTKPRPLVVQPTDTMGSPQCADTGTVDLVGHFGRRAPERHDRVSDKLVDRGGCPRENCRDCSSCISWDTSSIGFAILPAAMMISNISTTIDAIINNTKFRLVCFRPPTKSSSGTTMATSHGF